MADQFQKFMKVLKAFDKQKVDYVLIGGVAVILYGGERLTRDVDIFVKLDAENIEKLKKALHSVFNDPSIDEITLDELHNYPVIRYGTPNGFYIDIVTRLGKAVSHEDLEYEIIDYQGVKIRIGTPETLYDLKRNTVRQRDKMDAIFLKELINQRKSDHSDEEKSIPKDKK